MCSILKCASCRGEAHALQLIVLFPFHPAILKPNFDLPFSEAQSMGNFYPPSAGQIPIEMEFFLQL